MNKILIFILIILIIFLLYKIFYTDTFASVDVPIVIYSLTTPVTISTTNTTQTQTFPDFIVNNNVNNGVFAFSFLLNFKDPINTSLFSILDDKNNKIIEVILNENSTITNNLNYSSSSDIFIIDTNVSKLLKDGNNLIFIYTITNNSINLDITDYYSINYNSKYTTKNPLFIDSIYNINKITYSNYNLQIYNIKLIYMSPNIQYNTNIFILPPPAKPTLINNSPTLTADANTRLNDSLVLYCSFNNNSEKIYFSTIGDMLQITPDIILSSNTNLKFYFDAFSSILSKRGMLSTECQIGNASILLQSINKEYFLQDNGLFYYKEPTNMNVDLPTNNWNRVMSISFWMKNNNSPTNAVILQIPIQNHAISIIIDENNNLNLIYNYTNGIKLFNVATIIIFDQYDCTNVWTHVVVIFDNINKIAQLYINGILMNNKTFPTNSTQDNSITNNSCSNILIGKSGSNNISVTTDYYDGYLDDFRIYNRILDPIDIYNLKYYK